ncbi:HNH endonuclease [Ramlibacter tataouinensis]|uniref:HNH endonuclease n=1 Tax=Ramlibacter tataouinensis TaxID=94132 RepID=UPI0022F389F6|nr:HNH endonuclease [Ramlibacter tataouinensis]WBY02927.1 HNH endonuclease [Ramlibacter tataouinensis]
MRCILCKQTDGAFSTLEHAVPESLGGGTWSELPFGLVCDACQRYFGTKVERDALAEHPFLLLRTLLALPTKKRKAPWSDDPLEGRLESGGRPGLLHFEPAAHFKDASKKSVMRFVAQPRNPRNVCRFLLKMGIEAIAFESPEDALDDRYDPARAVARGTSQAPWWYLECDDTTRFDGWLCGTPPEGEALVELGIGTPAPGVEVVSFTLGPVTLIAPLKQNIYPDPGLEGTPDWRVYRV